MTGDPSEYCEDARNGGSWGWAYHCFHDTEDGKRCCHCGTRLPTARLGHGQWR